MYKSTSFKKHLVTLLFYLAPLKNGVFLGGKSGNIRHILNERIEISSSSFVSGKID